MAVIKVWIVVNLFSLCFGMASDQIYHITPSPSDPCPAKPCLILSQFAKSRSISNNTTLVFLPGKHSFESKLLVANIDKFLMTSLNNDSSTEIACYLSGTINFTNVHSVRISGLDFVGCVGNWVENVDSFTLEDSNFFGHAEENIGANGAALELYSTSIVISRSSFRFYRGSIQQAHGFGRANRGLSAEKEVRNTERYRTGGAIFSYNSSIIIFESRFERNSANVGGVIMNYQGSLKILEKCEFSDNEAYNNGGVIHAYQGTVSISKGNSFNRNMAHNNGGVIHAFESILNILGQNTFDNNTANNGGAIHAFEGNLTISNRNTLSKNVAYKDGGAIFVYQSDTTILEENIFSYNVALNDGGAIHAYQQKLNISDTKFLHNKANNDGGVIWAHEANTMTTRNYYDHNYAGNRGGVWNVYNGWHNVSESSLIHNEATDGGAIFADMSNLAVVNTTLVGNRASKGGALLTYQSTVFIAGTNFSQNSAQKYGGGWLTRDGSALVMDSVFEQNSASYQGGTWHIEDSNIILEAINITDNFANTGAALYATGCRVTASKSLLVNRNIANIMGTVYLIHSSFTFDGEVEFSGNYGSLVMFNSIAIFMGTTKFINCSEPNRLHDKLDTRDREGGTLTLFKSHVVFVKRAKLLYNYAVDGGAIHAVKSKIDVYGETVIANNTANKTGGGVYLFQSVINCQRNSSLKLLGNEAVEKGGGMHAVNSTINVEIHFNRSNISSSILAFIENKAEKGKGGGLYLDVYAKLYVKTESYSEPDKIIRFTRNSARYGGGVYESHSSDTGICLSPKFVIDSRAKECPIQIIVVTHGSSSLNFICYGKTSQNIFFDENLASISGSSLYSELHGTCNISFYDEHQCISPMSVNRRAYFNNISNINEQDIGSKPTQLCFCKEGKQDCNYNPGPMSVSNGTKFSVELVAVDQVGHPVDAVVRTILLRRGGYLSEGQEEQTIHRNCTEFNYNVFSQHESEVLKMHIENSNVKQTLNIQFTDCDTCPIGFSKSIEQTVCKCDCDPRVKPYITICDASREMLTREGDFWITYINTSDNATSGYLIYPFCPYNYCVPPTSTVEINLNLPDGADSQCANGHSGLLCGQCQSGLSLSLGSSRCMPCSPKWPIMLIVLLAAAFLAGIVLVVLLMSINLTIAVGTLNSIIFYANIVEANSSIFLPFSTPNIATVFIAGLNLEIGFDTCFFEGMDAYWKTLIQLAFPLYVVFLVIAIVFATEHSTRFAKLLARKNPVATLATLILLSYSKLLQTIIASLSFATLQYPDGSRQTVWLPDASVEYLKGKHIVLFIIAILILLAGGLYTTLLFSWQWLLRHQDKTLLRWMKYQKLCHFIEPYHAPYAFSQRYWFGLLLIARIPVYIISAVTRDPRFKLLSTSAVIICLLLVKVFSSEKQIYRKRLLDVLDTLMQMNVVSFSALAWYTFDVHSSQQACTTIAYLSVCITFTLLVCVVLYHVLRYTNLFSVIHKTKTSITKLLALKRNTTANQLSRVPYDTSDTEALVTYSTVELTECMIEADPVSSDHNSYPEEVAQTCQSHSTMSSNCEDCILRLESTLSE